MEATHINLEKIKNANTNYLGKEIVYKEEMKSTQDFAKIKYLAKDLGRDGIRINAISAGPIKTLSAKGIKDFSSILDIVEEKSPLHKNVTTREVWDTVSFLFSNMSSAITGEVIHVDNGFSTVGV